MELRHLRYFVAVAEDLNLTKAAARLRLAQPALSRQIHNLEEELGTRLFERIRLGVRLSRAGRAFLPKAKYILSQTDAAVQAARTADGLITGKLGLGFPSGLNLDHIRPLIETFRREHPKVEFDFHHATAATQLKALREGKLDLAYTTLPVKEEGLEHHVVWRLPFQVVMSRHHAFSTKKEFRLQDLRGQDFVFCTRESRPEFYDEFFRHCANAGFRPGVLKEVGGYPSNILALVALGVGLSVVPQFKGAEQIGGLVWRPLVSPRMSVNFALLWRKDDSSLLLREFIDAARKKFPDETTETGAEATGFAEPM